MDGAMTIRDLNRALDWSLPDDEANTLAGLVIHEAQMIPTMGQIFYFLGYRFEVKGRFSQNCTIVGFTQDHHLNPITHRCIFHVSKRQ